MADPTHLAPSSAGELSAIDAGEQCLRRGEPLLAYNAVQEGLQAFPASRRLRQLRSLALARSGDTATANRLLRELADEAPADAGTLGMLARTHEDLALDGATAPERDAHLAAAFRICRQLYDAARRSGAAADARSTGIDAAALAVLQGHIEVARSLAGEVRLLCVDASADPSAADAFVLAAALGEAALILGDPVESATHYGRAAALAAGRYDELGSTRQRAQLLAQRLPGDHGWIAAVLRIPPVVMYTGHMIDHPSRAVPRFPPELEAAVAATARAQLAGLQPMAAYGSAACGADILWLEAMHEIGGETHIVLPFPPEDFHRISVDFAPGGWSERFERVLADASSVTVTSEHRARGSNATFEYANFILTGMARLRAGLLQTELRGLAIWDGKSAGGGGGGAASLLNLWRSQQVGIASVRLPQAPGPARPRPGPAIAAVQDEQPPAGFTHEIRSMLFADAVGYGAIADLNLRTTRRPEHVETTGDGLYMVFRSAADAGHYALALNQLVTGTDWASQGLPAHRDIRLTLHCGPVYCGRNPLTGAPLYTGPHTSSTARIGPVTPPGQVYCSTAFAALAAAVGVDGLALKYVGRVAHAQGDGWVGLYHVQAAATAADQAMEQRLGRL